MKKLAAMILFVLLAQGVVFAADQGLSDREKLIAYKKAQREKKAQEKANPASQEKGFWAREASRSGLAGTGAMFTSGAWFHGGTEDIKKKS